MGRVRSFVKWAADQTASAIWKAVVIALLGGGSLTAVFGGVWKPNGATLGPGSLITVGALGFAVVLFVLLAMGLEIARLRGLCQVAMPRAAGTDVVVTHAAGCASLGKRLAPTPVERTTRAPPRTLAFEQLASILGELTSAQGARVVDLYREQRILVSGPLFDAVVRGETVMATIKVAERIHASLFFPVRFADDVRRLLKGAEVNACGTLKDINQHFVSLSDCELIQ